MARVGNFLYCLNVVRDPAQNGEGQSVSASGIASVFWLDYIPGTFSFSIYFSLLDVDDGNNTVSVVLKSPDGDELMNSGELNIPPVPENESNSVPRQYIEYQLSMDLRNVDFKTEGDYSVSLYYNGEALAKKAFRAMRKRN